MYSDLVFDIYTAMYSATTMIILVYIVTKGGCLIFLFPPEVSIAL